MSAHNDNRPCGFRGCAENALALAGHCWEHIPDKASYGAALLAALNGGADLAGANLKKVVLPSSRIEKANLRSAGLSQSSFCSARLFDTALDRAELIGADLSDCDLSHCSLRGADLTKARLARARLWNADLTGANLTEADLSGADLWNARLHNVKLWHTELGLARSITIASFAGESKLFGGAKIDESGALSAEEAYRSLKQYFLSGGIYDDASWASFKEKSMERAILKNKGDWNYLPSLVMNLLCGYGEKPYRIILAALSAILLFAAAYWSFGTIEPACRASALRWYDYIYYSAITFTTVGYGDIIPKSGALSRLLAAAEAVCGVFVTGLFIFTLARKYSAR